MTATTEPCDAGVRGRSRAVDAKRFFGRPDAYLTHNYRIPLRSRIVAELVGELRGRRILDLGCGDGSISAQFLPAGNMVTMVDFSRAMLDRARGNVPPEYASQVEYVCADVLRFDPPARYDLVLCIGLLAHVESVEDAVSRVARSVKPGGRVVFQINDDDSLVVRVLKWMYAIRDRFSRESLPWRGMTLSQVAGFAARHDLDVTALRRHLLLLFPGMARMLGKWLVPYDRFTQRHRLLARHGSNVIFVCTKRAREEGTA